MKRSFLFGSLIFCLGTAFAQSNVIKANLSKLTSLKAELAYERTFLKKFSAQVGFTTQIPTANIPGGGNLAKNALEASGISNFKYTGYAITPEVRFYLSPIKGSPKGIYLSAFGRYGNRVFNMTLNDTSNTTNSNLDARMTIKGIGGGLMLGHQWIIAKHVSIDFYIIGFGFNRHDVKLTAADSKYSKESYADWANSINTTPQEDNDLFSTPRATADGQSITITAGGALPIIRSLGFNIGVAF